MSSALSSALNHIDVCLNADACLDGPRRLSHFSALFLRFLRESCPESDVSSGCPSMTFQLIVNSRAGYIHFRCGTFANHDLAIFPLGQFARLVAADFINICTIEEQLKGFSLHRRAITAT
jgi:hypothetical protein